jgi:hypothetical protein
MATRNKTAGSNYERKIAKELREFGFDAVTSRAESRNLDDRGVDLVTNFPLLPQMKCSINQPNIHKLLTETDAEIIFFNKTEKANKKFVTKGEYVMMKKDKFYDLFMKYLLKLIK